MESGHRRRVLRPPLHPQLPEQSPGRRQQRRRRQRGRPGDHRRTIPARVSAADAAVSAGLRRQRRRPPAEAAGHRPANRPADDPGGGLARRGQAARHQGERRRSARAHSLAAGVPGERTVHRRHPLPPAPPDAEPADAPGRLRGRGPPQRRRREAPGGPDRLDYGGRQGRRAGIQEAQRKGQTGGRVVPGRQVPRGRRRERRRGREVLRGAPRRLSRAGKAEDPLRDDRSGSDAPEGDRHGPADRALLQRQPPAVPRRPKKSAPATSCSRPRARTTQR